MEPQDKYIPIAQFAKLVNLSPAAIYKRIKAGDESILTYVTEVDGKKRISKNALELFGVTCDESLSTEVTEVDNKINIINEEILNMLKAELESKNQQLAKKDEQIDAYIKQIADHNKQLENKDKQIAEQTRLVQESHYIAAVGQTIESNATEQQDPEKKGFWGWLKNKLK